MSFIMGGLGKILNTIPGVPHEVGDVMDGVGDMMNPFNMLEGTPFGGMMGMMGMGPPGGAARPASSGIMSGFGSNLMLFGGLGVGALVLVLVLKGKSQPQYYMPPPGMR